HVLEGQPFEVWGGEQLRDFTYVDDAVDALLLAATEDASVGRSFNLGGCEVLSLHELAAQLTALVLGSGFEVKTFPEERRKIDIGDYYSDYSAIRTTLGWAPRIPVGEGLARTLDYFRLRLDRYL
ncbi:MAG: NAD-dependent epimerase/dehydratase family protein, partial [Chromatiaceae bacterium]